MSKKLLVLAFLSVLLMGCATGPSPGAFLASAEQMARRNIETRKYEGISEQDLITASANVLQDLGYTLDNSETKLGMLSASKQRDATNAGQVAAAIVIALLGGGAMAVDSDQTIKVSLIVRPQQDTADNVVEVGKKAHFVRITFQRLVRRTNNSVYAENLTDEELFTGFFEKLSKSVFFEGQKI